MSNTILRIEVLSPTLVEVTPPPGEFAELIAFFSEHGLLSMRQPDCVVVEGSWRTVLSVLSEYDGDPWLSAATENDALIVS